MTGAPLILALPSKGRLKEQTEAWLADCGFKLEMEGGARGYRATLGGLPGADVRLISAGEIASALEAGDVHLGVTGEDLLRERGDGLDDRVALLRPLGFGRADLVVAAPQSWIDVETMADVDDVAHRLLARTGSRLRVATKYHVQTRRFFAERGIADYRIVESAGATEGAPSSGSSELVVDITTTGATLAANGLKLISDGLILSSQAQLAASLQAEWSQALIEAVRRLVSSVEARARGRSLSALSWPGEQHAAAESAIASFGVAVDAEGTRSALVPVTRLLDAAGALTAAGVGPLTVTRLDYVFEATCPAVDALAARVLG